GDFVGESITVFGRHGRSSGGSTIARIVVDPIARIGDIRQSKNEVFRIVIRKTDEGCGSQPGRVETRVIRVLQEWGRQDINAGNRREESKWIMRRRHAERNAAEVLSANQRANAGHAQGSSETTHHSIVVWANCTDAVPEYERRRRRKIDDISVLVNDIRDSIR